MNIYKAVVRSIIERNNIYIEVKNRFNYTQEQMYINHDKKTFKSGILTYSVKNIATKNEMNDIESLLISLNYRREKDE